MSEGSKTAQELEAEKIQNEKLDAERLAATNARLLKESQEYKAKYQAALREKEELEAKKLNESGDKDAMLEAEKRKAAKALEELKNTQKKVINQTVKEKVAKYAGDVFNVEDLLARPKFKDFLKEGLDKDSLDFNDDVAKRFVEETKKEAPYLWKVQGSIGVNTHRSFNTGTQTTVDTSKMSAKELRDYIAANFSK
jgi:hypothetical protein